MSESGSAAAGPPRRRRRRRSLIRVVGPIKPSTGPERLRRSLKGGGFGAVVSVSTHVLILTVLTWFLIDTDSLAPEEPLDLRWLTAREVDLKQAARAPVKISSVPDATPTAPMPPQAPPDTPMPLKPTRPAVRPVDVSGRLAHRKPELKRKHMLKIDEGGKSDLAVRSALGWFARQQQPTGNWRLHEGYPDAGRRTARTDTGATSLALLAFLGAGFDHTRGDHQQTVARGINWLVGQQRGDGNLFDIDEFGREEAFYAHSMGTIALCEAVALTADRKARQAAVNAVNFLVKTQQPTQGGWKYQPQTPMTRGDLSVTGWALMALHTARIANIEVPEQAFVLASNFLDSVEVQDGARYRYEPDFDVSRAMTAEGLLCLQFMGVDRNDPRMRAGADYLMKNLPSRSQQRTSYYWYYATQVMYHMQGKYWLAWNEPLRKTLVATQQAGGHMAGTWNPADNWENQGGRIYATAMKLLVLEVYYRHLPLYDQLDDE